MDRIGEDTKSAESAESESEPKETIPETAILAISPKSSRFTPPTVEQVRLYCEERGNAVDPQEFVDFYTAKGWKIGKDAMKDWQAAVRTWERRARDDVVKKGGALEQRPDAWTPDRIAEQRKAIEDRGTEPDIDFREAVKTDPFVAALLRG